MKTQGRVACDVRVYGYKHSPRQYIEMSSELHARVALPLGSKPPLDRKVGGPESRSERCVEDKSCCRCRNSKPNFRVFQPIVIFWQNYTGP
jgi:hypothetical protein